MTAIGGEAFEELEWRPGELRAAAPTLDVGQFRRRLGPSLPRLFVVGAPRAGTTTLYHMLARHPAIRMAAKKEPGFFHLWGQGRPWRGPGDRPGIARLEAYGRLFRGGREQLVGEASTVYLYSPHAAERIAACVPEPRIIAVLRHPVDRAYSNYMQHVMQGREAVTDFAAAIRRAPERLAAGWSPFWDYCGMGLYGRQLARYYDALPRSAILVLDYDEVVGPPGPLLRRICAFLGLPRVALAPPPGGLNASGIPRSRAANALLQQVRRGAQYLPGALRPRAETWLEGLVRRNLRRVPLDPDLRARLGEAFWRDTEEAGRLSGLDVRKWLPQR